MSGSAVAEFVIAAVLIALAVFVLNPMNFWMPDMIAKAAVVGIFVAFAVFAALVWRERPTDEREAVHQSAAGRVAYLAGTAVLALGVALQATAHAVDGWLVSALVVMVIAKIAARLWYAARR
jgi:hypothetical protein